MRISKISAYLLATIIGLSSALPALAENIDFPKTAAGRLAEMRLKAFNSGQAALLEAFKNAHDSSMSVENELALKDMTGGLDALRIVKNDAFHIAVILREKDGDRVGTMELEVDEKNPDKVAKFSLRPMPDTPEDLMPQRLSAELVWQRLQNKADVWAAQERFSGSVAIARKGQLLHQQSWGYADSGQKKENTAQTRYRVASMYKMMTAVAVLQLLEKDKIALDAPISYYLPNYPNSALANQVTVRHLLTHTGGTGEIFTEEFTQKREQLREHSDYVALFGQRDAAFTPGTQEQYSNYGYVLLGAIIEAVTGKPYHQVISEAILAPAGMRNTGSEPETAIAPQLSVGYMRTETGLQDNRNTLPWRGTAAGGGYSTTEDLIRFATALLQGQLLSGKSLSIATQPQTPSQLYGFGFQLGGKGMHAHFGHSGGAEGMSGALRIYPETGDIIVVLSNFDPPAADELVQYYGNRMPLKPRENASTVQKK